MATFTSSLPDELLIKLAEVANQLQLPKNRLIENALRIYIDELNRKAYLKSYKKMDNDIDILQMAEDRMEAYMRQIDSE